MYSVLRRGASTLFLALLLSLPGCGGSSALGPAPEGVPLDYSSISDSPTCSSSEEISDDPPVYRCDTASGHLFISSLKDCSASEKLSFQATTRQLFVGVTGLTVLSQEPVSFGQRRALQTIVTGTLDAQILSVSTFTFREKGCVTDVVVWRVEDRPLVSGEASRKFAQLSQSLAQHIVEPAEEPPLAKS